MTGVDKDLATLRQLIPHSSARARVEAELSRLREELDAAQRDFKWQTERLIGWKMRHDAAEARCARLQQALRDSGSLATAIRIGWQDGIPRDAETGLRRIEALAGPDTPADSQEPRDESGYPGLQGLEAMADSQPEETT